MTIARGQRMCIASCVRLIAMPRHEPFVIYAPQALKQCLKGVQSLKLCRLVHVERGAFAHGQSRQKLPCPAAVKSTFTSVCLTHRCQTHHVDKYLVLSRAKNARHLERSALAAQNICSVKNTGTARLRTTSSQGARANVYSGLQYGGDIEGNRLWMCERCTPPENARKVAC